MSHPRTLISLTLLGAALVSACSTSSSSPRRYRSASTDMSEELVAQVTRRTDARHVRVLVYEFTPCEAPGTASYAPDQSGHSEREFTRQIKHQIMSALARKVTVVEGERPKPASQDGHEEDPYAYAQELGANTVLVGNYTVTGKRNVLLMARLVDAESRQVLATAEETLDWVRVPHGHR